MRRIKKAKIEFISLVPAGANKLQPVYKSEDNTVSFGTLSKFDDKGELTAVVYAPEHRDSQNEIADAEVIKDAAYDFISNGAKIDIRHDGKAVSSDRARVAETFLVQKTDDRFQNWKDRDDNPVDLTGAWATVIKIDDPVLREKYRTGEWAGVSMGGTAIVEQEKSATLDDLVSALSKAMSPAQTTPSKEDQMDKEQFEALNKSLTDGLAAVTASLAKQAPEEPKQPAPKQPAVEEEGEAPIFKGDYADGPAVKAHSLRVQLFELQKQVDFTQAESVEDFLEKSAELREALAEVAPAKPTKTVRKAGPATGPAAPSSNEVPEFLKALPLQKGELDAMSAGAELASQLNAERLGKVK